MIVCQNIHVERDDIDVLTHVVERDVAIVFATHHQNT